MVTGRKCIAGFIPITGKGFSLIAETTNRVAADAQREGSESSSSLSIVESVQNRSLYFHFILWFPRSWAINVGNQFSFYQFLVESYNSPQSSSSSFMKLFWPLMSCSASEFTGPLFSAVSIHQAVLFYGLSINSLVATSLNMSQWFVYCILLFKPNRWVYLPPTLLLFSSKSKPVYHSCFFILIGPEWVENHLLELALCREELILTGIKSTSDTSGRWA